MSAARELLPDGLGYSTIDSNEASGPAFNYVDISSTGTVELLGDDDSTFDTPIGFTFNFYDVDYTTLDIGSNGYLSFVSSGDRYNLNSLPIPQPTGTSQWQDPPFIAPWFDDLDPDNSAAGDPIFWETLGTAPNRRFVVQYKVSHISVRGEPLDFEVILFEGSNEILFQYRDATLSKAGLSNGRSATVGIQGIDTSGVNYQANEGAIADGLAILFSPPAPGPFVGINASVKRDEPGTDVTHTASVFNRSGVDQDFTITLMPGSQWTTTLPATTGLILDGDTATFDLTVSIPALNDLEQYADLAAIQITGNGLSALQNIITQSFPGRKLTNDAARASFDSSLSADGSRVAFESSADLIPGSNPAFQTQIFVSNSNASSPVTHCGVQKIQVFRLTPAVWPFNQLPI